MISRLLLRDFRNYASLELGGLEKVNIFSGDNGQGKTNLLESIFFLGMLRSFRTSQIKDIKRIGSSSFYIGADLSSSLPWKRLIEVDYGVLRRLRVDSSPVLKASEFIRQLKVVAFSPDDINIVAGNSGLRRRFIDIFSSVLSHDYLSLLQQYVEVLRHRNALLKKGDSRQEIFGAYEELMAELMVKIVLRRIEHLKGLEKETKTLVSEFYGEDTPFEMRYRFHQSSDDEDSCRERLAAERKKEIQKGFTSFGPHLDEIEIFLNRKLMRNYGSSGQCRLVSLCLKMAETKILNSSSEKENPVIALVDDVTGELDSRTKELFFKTLKNAGQIFFTFTQIPQEDIFADARIFKIREGKVSSVL
ncbi:MAG: hypothetical protein A2X49_11775 [Lentisphaerae bacterium GWF2_52_8]|nr:MAG: hypothetical protein A2X49_11775 [Lentisphaerae bacterium GWF2_52_8]